MVNQNQNACMPKEDFSALSLEVGRIWSKTAPDMKAITLRSRTRSPNDGENNHSQFFCKPTKPPSYPPRKIATAHLHELFTGLISESSLSEQNEASLFCAAIF